jgi:hypothetical protein
MHRAAKATASPIPPAPDSWKSLLTEKELTAYSKFESGERPALAPMAKKKKRALAHTLACPFCAEEDTIDVDISGGMQQRYVEDCAVCCRPRTVHVAPSDEPGVPRVWLERAD